MRLRRPCSASRRLLLAVLTVPAGCVGSDTVTEVGGRAVAVAIQPAVVPSPSNGTALPVNRIRVAVTALFEEIVVGEAAVDVDPGAAEWTVDVPLQLPSAVSATITVWLIHVTEDGTEEVQFSGRIGPLTVGSGPIQPDVPIVRGPLANLGTTSVEIVSAPTVLPLGGSAPLAAVATTNDGAEPSIFWTALDDAVLSISGDTATAVAVGTTRVVASAGSFADTVTIDVLDTDSIAPIPVSTSPAAGATGVPRVLPVSITFSEEIAAASVIPGTFVLRDSLDALVAANVASAGPVLTLTPDAPLDAAHRYTATVGADVSDLAGNLLGDPVTWSFSTGGLAIVEGSFDPGLGLLVAIAFDDASGDLYVHDDFSDTIRVFDTSGVATGATLVRPGLSSNDIDLDVVTTPVVFGQTSLAVGTLLVHNGEASPGTLFALDPSTGVVLDSAVIDNGGNVVGGALHPSRGTYFAVSWNTDVISEIDLETGAIVNSFPVQPAGSTAYDVFYGDIDVDAATGDILIVSSADGRLRVLTADGAWVQDYDLTAGGVSGASGIAWDDATRTAWISATTGLVWRVSGIG